MNLEKLIVIGIMAVFATFCIAEFNKFITLKNKIKQSKSSIDIYLDQRFSLIPNLVACVKGYCKYEESVYTKISELRLELLNQKNKDLKKAALLNSECNRLLAVGESNPNLKANSQFMNLQKNLEKMESQLMAAKRIYNGDVTLYNNAIGTFPGTLFAYLFAFKEEDLFEIEEYKKQNIEIDL